MPRARAYAALGAVVALAAPAWLLVTRILRGRPVSPAVWPDFDVAGTLMTNAYASAASVAALAWLGYVVGRQLDRVRVLSVTDSLTGAFNRRYFEQRVLDELERARRHGHATAVLCVDVDGLKAVNDAAGHPAGDRALVAVSAVLGRSARAMDCVARLGGDEFAVLLPATSAAQASVVAVRILAELHRGAGLPSALPTLSIGIAEAPAVGVMGVSDLLQAADEALYRAKSAGGARICAAPVEVPRPVLGSGVRQDASCVACHGERLRGSSEDVDDAGLCAECAERALGPFEASELGGQG